MLERAILPKPLGEKIERLIAALQTSLTAEEANAGWDQSLKARWADWFVNLRAELESGNATPPGGALYAPWTSTGSPTAHWQNRPALSVA